MTPPDVSPRLWAAVERIATGVRVDYDDGNNMWWVSGTDLFGMGDAYSRDEAIALYFEAVAELQR